MTNKVFVIRHGESEKNKLDPKRGLTLRGKRQMRLLGKRLLAELDERKILIVTTDQYRTTESVKFFIGPRKVKVKINPDLRVANLGELTTNKPPDLDLTFYYFSLFETNSLPITIQSPKKVANRFLKEVDKNYETIIFIGHSGAIESFVNYQKVYIPAKKLNQELKYAEVVELNGS